MGEWQALAAGLAFYFIIEGLLPFLNPSSFKRAVMTLATLPDHLVRRFGVVMIMLGVIILFFVTRYSV